MSAPNLLSNTTFTAKGNGGTVGTSLANSIANAAASGTAVIVRVLVVSNVHATSTTTIEATLYDGVNDRHLCKTTSLAPGEALTLPCPLHLEEGYSIRLSAGIVSVLEWAGSYEVWS
jgi:hypothetical protein